MRSCSLIQDLEYADDMALISDFMDALEEVLRSLNVVCSSVGLSISLKITKIFSILSFTSLSDMPCPVQLKPEEEPMAVVEEFEYHGDIIS